MMRLLCSFMLVPWLLSTALAGLPDKKLYGITNPRLNPQELDFMGATLASTSQWLAMGLPRAEPTLSSGERGQVKLARLDFSLSSTTQFLHLTLSNPRLSDGGQFGASLALDGNTLLVAAYENPDAGNPLQGNVYVYDLLTTEGAPTLTLSSPVVEGFERFGSAVAISATHMAIAGAGINTAAAGAGVVHIYDRSSPTPAVPVFSLPNPSPASWERFGHALALQGSRLFVSDPGENEGRGQVWVYELSGPTPSVPIHVLASPMAASENEAFGHALAVDADRLVVGAPNGLGANGRAYVFDMNGVTPTIPVHSYANPVPFIWEAFGSSVAVRGSTIAIGCPADVVDFGNFIGSVFLYDLAGPHPDSPLLNLQSPVSVAGGESFSHAVAFGQNSNDLLVGAPGNDRVSANAGDVYRFGLNGAATPNYHGGFNQLHTSERFGRLADLDGDRLVVLEAGHLYAYDLASATPALPSSTTRIVNQEAGEVKAVSISLQGARVAVGVQVNRQGFPNAGRVYVLELFPGGSHLVAILEGLLNDDLRFGEDVEVQGDWVIVGCPGGRYVQVFDLSSALPNQPLHQIDSTLTNFGHVLSFSGGLLAVGTNNSSMRVQIYDLASAPPFTPIRTLSSSTAAGSALKLSLSGRRLLMGYDSSSASIPVNLYDLDSSVPTAPLLSFTNPNTEQYSRFGAEVTLEGNNAYIAVKASVQRSGETVVSAYGYDLTSAVPTVPALALLHTGVFGEDDDTRPALTLSGDRLMVGVPGANPDVFARGVVNLFGVSQPEISIERTEGVVISGPQLIELGYVEFDPFYYYDDYPLSLTIRNLGADPLQITGLSKAGPQLNMIRLAPSVDFPRVIQSGESLVLNAAWLNPNEGLGSFQATVRLHSNDQDESIYSFTFQGVAVTAQQLWRFRHFGTLLSEGVAADDLDPDGDGQTNLEEYAADSSPTDPSSRLRLIIADDPIVAGQKIIQIAPLYRRSAYRIEVNDGLDPAGWQTLWSGLGDIPSLLPRPDPGAVGKARRFYRVHVLRDPL